MALGFSQSSRRTSREEALNEVLAEETRTVAGRQMHQALSEGPRDNLPLTPSSSPTPEPPLRALPTENVWEYDPDRHYEYDSITTATALPAVISKSTSTALPTVVSTPTGTAAAEAVRNEPTSTRVPTQRHSDAVSLDGARAHAEALAKIDPDVIVMPHPEALPDLTLPSPSEFGEVIYEGENYILIERKAPEPELISLSSWSISFGR